MDDSPKLQGDPQVIIPDNMNNSYMNHFTF